MSEEKGSTVNTPPKYSRYKSVRHTLQPKNVTAPPEQSTEQNVQRTKSMSRYRRSRVSMPKPEQPPMPQAPVPALPSMLGANTVATRNQSPAPAGNPSAGRNTSRQVTEPVSGARSHHTTDDKRGAQTHSRSQETEDERLRRKIKEFQDREEPKKILAQQQEEEERLHQLRKLPTGQAQIDALRASQRKAAQEAEGRQYAARSKEAAARALAEEKERITQLRKAPVETEADRARRVEEENAKILAEQKRKDLERLQKELDAAVPVAPPAPKLQSVTSPLREKFSFFSRKKESPKDTPPQTPKSAGTNPTPPPISAEAPRLVEKPRLVDAPKEIKKPKEVEKSLQIGQGGGGIVPQTDAPISASNAGERRVLIRCKQSSINLPITPETTPFDLIYSAANIMTQNIIPSTAILLESYTQLGLERRVRRYEHVRDVMNSWDRDTQNSFILQNSDSPKFDTDLEVSSVSTEPPADTSVYMYHSQKPGKWNKRYITLLSSGQIYMSKRSGTKLSEKDAVNLCHLSDFDIYTPTPQQIRKTLKPPKKHCYAVKSQQKTTMFLSTENFVHFFSSDDEQVAEKWYSAVQGWRSWYLVNRMGEGRKKAARKDEQHSAGIRNGLGHASLPSVDENPYTIGSFTPLFEVKSFGSSGDDDDEHTPRQVPFHMRNSLIISPDALKRESRRHPPPVSYRIPGETDGEFASDGLLGRTYSQRQRDQRDKDDNQRNGTAMDGRTFSMASTKSRRPNTSGDGLKRNSSQRKPKPLLDFTPQFKEAPQWDKTGKGHGVAPTMGLPLVETATTPASGLDDIPKATVFRREASMSRPRTAVSRGGQGGSGFVSGGLLSGLNNPKGGGSMMNRGRVVYD